MALAADIIWEVETTGADENGGGFDPVSGTPGTDYSHGVGQTTIEWAVAGGDFTNDLASTSASSWLVLTSATRNFVAADVGNMINISAGTNFTPGRYQILSVAANAATLDRACGSVGDSSSGSGVLGGPLLSPGTLSNVLVNGNDVHIESGTYPITTATPGDGGPIQIANLITCFIKGYNSTRGDLDATIATTNNPLLQASGVGSFTGVDLQNSSLNSEQAAYHLTVDGNTQASVDGFVAQAAGHIFACKADDCDTGFGANANAGRYSNCFATDCTTGFEDARFFACAATLCSTSGFRGDDDTTLYDCLAYDNTGDGFLFDDDLAQCSGCTSDGNTGDGFDVSGRVNRFSNCVSTNNGGYGWRFANTNNHSLINTRTFNNTSGPFLNEPDKSTNWAALTADPWVDASADDYRPNDTAGGGAELRAAAFAVPEQTNNRDIGAVQHADPAGGGGGLLVHPGTSGGARG